jgi:DNA-binding transcriptional LysR family regulator
MAGGEAMNRQAALHDVSALDMGQVQLLHLLLTRASVSAVATTLGVSQPAVSLRLARLRETFGDQLLVRSGSRMVPTDRGRALIEPLEQILDAVQRLGDGAAPFDPATCTRSLRIAAPNYLGGFLLPPLAQRLKAAAPGIRLSLQTMVPGRDYGESLGSGEIDLLVSNWPDVPGHLRSVTLPRDRLVCFVAVDHPLAGAGRIDLSTYLDQDHVSPSHRTDWRTSPVDAQLARLRLRRRISVVAPNYTLLPQFVARTRLVLTTGARFADFALSTAPVRMLEAPEAFAPVTFRILWHERSQSDRAHAWARGVLREIVKELGEPGPRPESVPMLAPTSGETGRP